MNEYAQKVLELRKAQAPWETEFLQAVTEVFETIDSVIEADPRIEQNKILERMTVPERIVTFQVPWMDANNENEQYLQLFYAKNCYALDGSAADCIYIGGWVYASSMGTMDGTAQNNPILGQAVTISVSGNTFTASISGKGSITLNLDGSSVGKSFTPYSQGGFGVVSWQDNHNLDLKIENLFIY